MALGRLLGIFAYRFYVLVQFISVYLFLRAAD